MIKHLLLVFFIYFSLTTLSVAQSSGFGTSKSAELTSNPSFFPNPAADKLFLNTDFSFQSIEIYDLSGNLRLSATSFDDSYIDITSLKPSIYLIKIVSTKGVSISKLTVKR